MICQIVTNYTHIFLDMILLLKTCLYLLIMFENWLTVDQVRPGLVGRTSQKNKVSKTGFKVKWDVFLDMILFLKTCLYRLLMFEKWFSVDQVRPGLVGWTSHKNKILKTGFISKWGVSLNLSERNLNKKNYFNSSKTGFLYS